MARDDDSDQPEIPILGQGRRDNVVEPTARANGEGDTSTDGERKPLPGSSEAKRDALEDPGSPESKLLQELKNRDREVRTHEQAHLAAAGQYARGGPVYEYERGPDGRSYAVGGHVNIDSGKIPGDPEATLRKAEVIRRAALAPAEPSPQDRRVAAKATSMASDARQEIMQIRLEEISTKRATAQAANDDNDAGNGSGTRADLEQKIRDTGAKGDDSSGLHIPV